jgi:UDP-glucuronate decarboxylase
MLSNLIVQALQGKNITIYGNGFQTRSFYYIDDLINAMIRILTTDVGFTAPLNIGNQGEFSMLKLAELLLKPSDSKSKNVYQPLPSDEPNQCRPNIYLARAKLGWTPKLSLEDGLRETIRYFKNYFK